MSENTGISEADKARFAKTTAIVTSMLQDERTDLERANDLLLVLAGDEEPVINVVVSLAKYAAEMATVVSTIAGMSPNEFISMIAMTVELGDLGEEEETDEP